MRAAILIVALAGCVFEGPAPSEPKKATVLFALDPHPLQQDDCQAGAYIGHVAIADVGYLVTNAFVPACGGDGGGGNMQQIPSTVWEFDKRSHAQTKIGDAGMTAEGGNASKPRIAAVGNEVVWMFGDGGGIATVRSKSGLIAGTFAPMSTGGIPNLVSIVVDANASYIATATDSSIPRVMSPRYPCCGPGTNMNGGYSFMQLVNSASITSATKIGGEPPKFFNEQMKESLIANTSSLFFVEHATPVARVVTQPKGGGASETIAMLVAQPGGLAANEAHVAWSTTVNFLMSNTDARACSIFFSTAAAPRTETMLLSTTKFSCFDLALDGDYLYFTMVEQVRGEFNDLVRNLGIGRVQLSTKNVETLALGIPGPQAAPRQLFVDGDGVIVVAPFVIARIAKAELDGQLDIAP